MIPQTSAKDSFTLSLMSSPSVSQSIARRYRTLSIIYCNPSHLCFWLMCCQFQLSRFLLSPFSTFWIAHFHRSHSRFRTTFCPMAIVSSIQRCAESTLTDSAEGEIEGDCKEMGLPCDEKDAATFEKVVSEDEEGKGEDEEADESGDGDILLF
ncbi:uncharacterized protein MONOS_3450 [Monocercomonoides exilis]|uniref:uncharacterized protein n=1 Tax=Monocercomonoides exilis TaxID=2049356 RepID=UPI00355AA804|nr:hypothetical protein MONOS_3450 [Monocercomonoides exilis]|eukprot:MONOS_3450.1-p1 / transcript=MONOS_3450.1 / gene=MONOS_3450 / organism=Monocercomonoides_exilis_PA203 / gene_product=unspecified product / transcript_product=unspecified product / location=Mono_scaffold00081:91264-91722(+) / protein_length=153 / sequence_SO=supercontig / SO=protein_coding / is_pseudo=false